MGSFSFALRTLRHNTKFASLFALNLAIGLFGYLFLLSVQEAARTGADSNLRTLLTADIAVTSNEPISQAQIATLNTITKDTVRHSYQQSFFSMVRGTTNSRLLRIAAIDAAYPLYGTLALAKSGVVNADTITKQLQKTDGVWMQETTRELLGVTLGGTVQIGSKQFVVRDDVVQSPAALLGFARVAPTLYIGSEQLAGAGLINKGSRVRYTHFYAFLQDAPVVAIAQQITNSLGSSFDVITYHNASNRTVALVQTTTGYLGLIALVALFLSGVSAAYLFQWYLHTASYTNAIAQALGAQQKSLYLHGFWQLCVLVTLATLIALTLLVCIIPFVSLWLAQWLPLVAGIRISWSFVLFSWLCMLLYGCAFCAPQIFFCTQVRPATLLRESFVHNETTFRWWQKVISILLPLVTFASFAMLLVDLFTALFFIAGFAVMLLVIIGGYSIFIALVRRLRSRSFFIRFLATRILNNRYAVATPFVAVALCALLVTIVPTVAHSVKQDMTMLKRHTLPDFFLFDIQPEQVEPLRQFIAQRTPTLGTLSPMIQARILEVNNIPFAEYRQKLHSQNELAQPRTSRRTLFNISYRAEMSDAEELLEGNYVQETYDATTDEPVALSLADTFAKRYQLTIGDMIVFDVQGIEITGQITSIRKVLWRSFQPNFFIIMQPGVLELAPKTYLATVANVQQPAEFTMAMSSAFSNISVVDVSQVIGRILTLADMLGFIISAMSYLVLLAAISVVFCIARTEAARATWEMSLLQTLGTSAQLNQALFVALMTSIALCALLLGQGLSFVLSYLFARFVLQSELVIAWSQVTLVTFFLLLVIVVTAYLATKSIVSTKPWRILRSPVA